MDTAIHDIRYGIRVMTKNPLFTLVAVVTLALGIGATTAIFSVVDAVILRPLPYPHADRLAMVWMNNTRMAIAEDWHSWPNYVDYRDQNTAFESIAAFNNRSVNLTGEGEPLWVLGAWSTANLFSTLGVSPIRGRTYTAEEEESGKDALIVLGYGLWQSRFGGDPEIVGKSIQVNGAPRTVIGVMPAGFAFPRNETELWMPVGLNNNRRQARGTFWIQAVGRLKPDVTVEQAQRDLEPIAGRLQQDFADALAGYGVNVVRYHQQVVGSVKPALLILLGAVACVLLIACVNVANLLLSRAAAREKEIAIRTAVGASRGRLVRQLLVESAMLALVSGAVGVVFAKFGLNLLVSMSPRDVPRLDQVTIDGQVLSFSLAISMLTGLVFGIVPAIQASRPNLNATLKESGRGSTAGIQGRRVRNALVVSEIAIALVLLVGAGLMIRSFMRVQDLKLGLNPDNVLTLRLQLSGAKYRENPAAIDFYKQAIERVEALPGVQSAGAISDIFLSQTPSSSNFSIEGRPDFHPTERIETPIDAVSPKYFQVAGTPLLKGRFFDERDGPESSPVVMINDTMARRFWPDEDPLGKRIKYGDQSSDDSWKTIVGIVADARRTGFDHEVRCETFLPHSQAPSRGMFVAVRTSPEPVSMAPSIRDAIWEIDKDQPIFDIKPMTARLGDMVAKRRLNTILFAIFAGVGLLLAGIGIYGVMSYSVAQRTHEMGVRMALGAQPGEVRRMVLKDSFILALIGLGIGLAAAALLTRVMTSLLYGISAIDPPTFAAVPVALAAVSLLASYLPARRATRVDPMLALRCE